MRLFLFVFICFLGRIRPVFVLISVFYKNKIVFSVFPVFRVPGHFVFSCFLFVIFNASTSNNIRTAYVSRFLSLFLLRFFWDFRGQGRVFGCLQAFLRYFRDIWEHWRAVPGMVWGLSGCLGGVFDPFSPALNSVSGCLGLFSAINQGSFGPVSIPFRSCWAPFSSCRNQISPVRSSVFALFACYAGCSSPFLCF